MSIDPTTAASFGFVGTFEYNEGVDSIDSPGELPDPHDLELRAVVYFPADSAGTTTLSQISSTKQKYPLVVVVHGNSASLVSYKGYNYLLEHLARNGMIAASIHIYPNAMGISRARALLRHIEILRSKFEGRIDMDNIGLMGHSRGGEGVVIASKLNFDEVLGYKFKAIIALAPTDQYGPYSLAGNYKAPFLVIYGGLDGDVAGHGPKQTGFSLYDRADGVKSFLFVQGACHDKFNVEWQDHDLFFGNLTEDEQSNVISADAHQKIVKGYMNAFFLWHIFGRSEFSDFFTGKLIPEQVAQSDDAKVVIHTQYQAKDGLFVDRFSNTKWGINDLGDNVTHNSTLLTDPLEGDLFSLDRFSPHDANGALIKWNNNNGVYVTQIPKEYRNVSKYEYLSFRISQRYKSTLNPIGASQDLYIKFTDGNGKFYSIKVSEVAAITYPYVRGFDIFTKSALKTIRIPLDSVHEINLADIISLSFEFKINQTGEIDVTDIEFGY